MHIMLLKYIDDTGRLYQRLLAPAREAAGLTQAELDILLFLANNPQYDTASDIVSVRRMAKSNVSVGVKSLIAKGFLLRYPDEKDHRVEHLRLTAAAAPVAALGRECQEAFGQTLTRGLASEDLAELKRLTDHIQQNVSQALDNKL